ncbi:unnamed protein product [Soboliphyme baturini]|uniref:Protein yae1 n=1 Tax=Soboliphyme baturini TaxID=241478 RepID=A0A183J7T5_9BILA|nr:unnamed protein product [Soboliphyme baturini]
MADFLEDESAEDRVIDNRDYLHSEMNIFKQNFRTSVIASEERELQRGFDNGFQWSFRMSRQLGIARGVLAALLKHGKERISVSNEEDAREISQQLDALADRLSAFADRVNEDCAVRPSKTADEFTSNILPSFDALDMELFGVLETTDTNLDSDNQNAAESFRIKYANEIKKIEEDLAKLMKEFSNFIAHLSFPVQLQFAE